MDNTLSIPPDEDPSEVTEVTIDDLVIWIVEGLENNVPQEDLVATLTENGMVFDDAVNLVHGVVEHRRKELRKKGIRGVVWGAVLLALGIGITAATYASAGPSGGFIITIGLILWGSIKLIVGMVQLWQPETNVDID